MYKNRELIFALHAKTQALSEAAHVLSIMQMMTAPATLQAHTAVLENQAAAVDRQLANVLELVEQYKQVNEV